MSIKNNIAKLNARLAGTQAKLIAVTKTKPVELLLEAYQAGAKTFGENRVQELVPKYEALPKDIEWHLIGHLQSNKVKYIAPFVAMIHSIDSLSLLKEVNRQALRNERVIDCLLQIYIAQEETKFGLSQDEALELLKSDDFAQLHNIRIVGLMGMATNTDDQAQIRAEFASLKDFFEQLKQHINKPNVVLSEVSMGMSSDYAIAIEEGSTMIRVGSSIFGSR
jgi:PLP dependent protein